MLHAESERLVVVGGAVGDSGPRGGAVVFRHQEDGPVRIAGGKAGERGGPLQRVVRHHRG